LIGWGVINAGTKMVDLGNGAFGAPRAAQKGGK
jgi:hypothetical protein